MSQDINKEVRNYINDNFPFESYLFGLNDKRTRNIITHDLTKFLEDHHDIGRVGTLDITTENDIDKGAVRIKVGGFYGKYYPFDVNVNIGV